MTVIINNCLKLESKTSFLKKISQIHRLYALLYSHLLIMFLSNFKFQIYLIQCHNLPNYYVFKYSLIFFQSFLIKRVFIFSYCDVQRSVIFENLMTVKHLSLYFLFGGRERPYCNARN